MEELEFLSEVRKWFESEKNNMAEGNFLQVCLSIFLAILLVISPFLPHLNELSKEDSGKLTSIFNILNTGLVIVLLGIALFVFIESILNGKKSVLSFVFDFLQKWAGNIVVTIFTVILPIVAIFYKLLVGYGLVSLLIGAIHNNTNPFFVASFVLFALKFILNVVTIINKNYHKLLFKKLNSSQRIEFNSYKKEARIPNFLLKLLWSLSDKQKIAFCDNCDEIIIKLDSRIETIKREQKKNSYLRNSKVTESESVAPAIIKYEK